MPFFHVRRTTLLVSPVKLRAQEIVWNPFPNSAHIGIIISSLSQAGGHCLQCLQFLPFNGLWQTPREGDSGKLRSFGKKALQMVVFSCFRL